MVALFNLTNTPLCNCLNLRSCMIFLHVGSSFLILHTKVLVFQYQIIKGQALKYGRAIQLKNHSKAHLVYLPSGSDDESDFSFSGNVEISFSLSLSQRLNDISIFGLVLIVVFFSVGNELLSLFSSLLSFLISSILELLQQLGVSGLLLLNVLGDNSTEKTLMFLRYTLAC